MKKKGFTLVELLAVIAILAILVIVAMPNVLGMFGEAKVNTFVTEVQKYMDTAKTAFVQKSFSEPSKTLVFMSGPATDMPSIDAGGSNTHAGKLDMDGSKEYYIVMDRHGNFQRVMIWDESLCFNAVRNGLEKNDVNSGMIVDRMPEDKALTGCAGYKAKLNSTATANDGVQA